MMRRSLLILSLLIAATVCRADVSIDRVTFHGVREFSSRELSRWLDLPLKRDVPEASLSMRLSALVDSLVVRDYLFARLDSFNVREHKRRTELHVYLREGVLPRVAQIRWLGDSVRVAASVAHQAVTRSGSAFHWTDVEFDATLLLDYFETSGYPFARVEVAKVEPDPAASSVIVWLQISSGPLTRLGFVSFSGNRQTREPFLLRESRLRPGALYDQRRIDSARRRLRRLEFVRQVYAPELVVNDAGETGVHFDLEEARSTLIDIVAGYQPAGEDRSGDVSGLANLEFLNLFGVGRKGRVHWERPSSRTQAVEVAYTEPWILNQPVSLRLDFSQRIQDTLYVQRSFGAQAGVDLGSQVSAWGAARREAVYADSQAAAFYNLPDSRTTYLETGISFDTRDEPLNSRGGVYFSTFIGNGWRERDEVVSGRRSVTYRQQRGGLDSEIAHEVIPFWIIAVSVHARAIHSTEPEILLPDLYRLGGARSLRGYREEQFLGSRIGWSSAEIRYWLGPLSRFFLFADAGGAYREQLVSNAPSQSTIYRAAAGLGLRLETNMGVWGFDYGVGQEDRLLSGKLHVSLLSSF